MLALGKHALVDIQPYSYSPLMLFQICVTVMWNSKEDISERKKSLFGPY